MRKLLFGCMGIALGVALYHVWLRQLMLGQGLRLGAVSAELVPFYGYWRPHLKVWLVAPVLVLGIYLATLRRSRAWANMPDGWAAVLATAFFLAITVSVALLDEGPRGLIGPLVARPDLEYFGAIDRVGDVRAFWRDYPRLMPTLPMHAQVHPPGAVVFVWGITRLLGGGPWAAAAGIIGTGALMVPLVFLWGRRLAGPDTARRTAALFLVTPSVVLFTATCLDAVFAVPLIAAMAAFSEALERRPLGFGLLAGLAAGLAALLTYSVALAGLFCVLAAILSWWDQPARRRQTSRASLAALAGFLGVHLAVVAATGFDPIATFLCRLAELAPDHGGDRSGIPGPARPPVRGPSGRLRRERRPAHDAPLVPARLERRSGGAPPPIRSPG